MTNYWSINVLLDFKDAKIYEKVRGAFDLFEEASGGYLKKHDTDVYAFKFRIGDGNDHYTVDCGVYLFNLSLLRQEVKKQHLKFSNVVSLTLGKDDISLDNKIDSQQSLFNDVWKMMVDGVVQHVINKT